MSGLFHKQFQDEGSAREHLGKLLWPNGPVCPHRGVIENIYKVESKPATKAEKKIRKGVYNCGGCRNSATRARKRVTSKPHKS